MTIHKPWSALCVLVLALSGSVHALEVGQAAPDFELSTRQGTLRLSDAKAKAVYLDFWASWCGPCKQSFPWMNDMQARYASQGLKVIAVNVDQRTADATAFLAANPAQFDVAFDPAGKTPRTFGVKGMPTSLLLGADGKVQMVHSGFRDDQRAELEQAIRKALQLKD